MRERAIVFCLAALLITGQVAAQTCGNGLPCGPIPWQLPNLPDLSSPTPMPTIAVEESSVINPGQPTNTPVPIPTITPIGIDTEGISEQMDSIAALLQQTPVLFDSDVDLGIDLDGSNILINSDFESWSGDNPVSWIVGEGGAPNSMVTEVANGARIFRSGSLAVSIEQAVMTVGAEYTALIDVIRTTGGLQVRSGTTTHATLSTTGIHEVEFTATNATFRLQTSGTSVDLVIQSVTLEPVIPPDTALGNLTASAGTFFSYARGLSGETFGPMAPLISTAVIALALVASVKIITFILPIVIAFFGIVRKIISLILEFLPL